MSQITEQSKTVQQPQSVVAPSIEMTQKPIEKRTRLMNIIRNLEVAAQNPSNFMDQTGTLSMRSVEEKSSVITHNQSQDDVQLQVMHGENSTKSTALLSSMAISSQEINDEPRINLKRSQNVNTVDPRNTGQSFTNVASASQSGLSSSLKRPSCVRQLDEQRSLPSQQQYPTQSYQNQYIPTNQLDFKHELLKESTESNNYDHRSNCQTISVSTPSIGQNSIIPSSPLYQTSKLPQRGQLQPTQQDLEQQPQKPKIPIGISTMPKNNRQTPTLQRVTNETLSSLTKVVNSERPALSTTPNESLLNEHHLQGNHSERALVNENHLNVIDTMVQTDEWMVEKTPLAAYHGTNPDTNTVTDHEVISDHEMSTEEAPTEGTNNFYGTGITSGSSYADRPIAAQNPTNYQMHAKDVLKQQMLDNFGKLFIQMRSTLHKISDMRYNLRNSIFDSAETYRKLSSTVQRFHSAQNLASNASSSSKLTQEGSARANSGNTYQYSKNVANKQPEKKHNNLRRFVLPPEYNPNDSKWTLKYRKNQPGLVELIPQTGIYVSYKDLKYCKYSSKDCKSLARRLLQAVFNRKALSVCLSMAEKVQASDNVGSNIRPELDGHACSVLLRFVLEHGHRRGWNTDLNAILRTLHSKIKYIRFKYGARVKC